MNDSLKNIIRFAGSSQNEKKKKKETIVNEPPLLSFYTQSTMISADGTPGNCPEHYIRGATLKLKTTIYSIRNARSVSQKKLSHKKKPTYFALWLGRCFRWKVGWVVCIEQLYSYLFCRRKTRFWAEFGLSKYVLINLTWKLCYCVVAVKYAKIVVRIIGEFSHKLEPKTRWTKKKITKCLIHIKQKTKHNNFK